MNYRETITSGQSQQKIVPMSILRQKYNSLRLAESEAISLLKRSKREDRKVLLLSLSI